MFANYRSHWPLLGQYLAVLGQYMASKAVLDQYGQYDSITGHLAIFTVI